MNIEFITLFGCRIPFPTPDDQEPEGPTTRHFLPDNPPRENPSDVQERDRAAPGTLAADVTLTLSTAANDDVDLSNLRAEVAYSTDFLGLRIQDPDHGGGDDPELAVLSPEPPQSYNRHSVSSSETGSKLLRKFKKPKRADDIEFITLFGCRIPFPTPDDQEPEGPTTRHFLPDNPPQENPSDVQERDRGAPGTLAADVTLTLSTAANDDVDLSNLRAEVANSTDFLGLRIQDPDHGGGDDPELAVLSPEPPQWYNRHSVSSSETTGSKLLRKFKKQKRADDVIRVRIIRIEPGALQPRSDLSLEFLGMISPARPVFLYRKQLSDTDVDSKQNRLLVTDTDKLSNFLTQDESAMSKFKVIAIDMNGREYEMKLSKCREEGSEKGVFAFNTDSFNTDWSLMLGCNGVVAGDFVELWGFRRGRWRWSINELCLAVVFTRG